MRPPLLVKAVDAALTVQPTVPPRLSVTVTGPSCPLTEGWPLMPFGSEAVDWTAMSIVPAFKVKVVVVSPDVAAEAGRVPAASRATAPMPPAIKVRLYSKLTREGRYKLAGVVICCTLSSVLPARR